MARVVRHTVDCFVELFSMGVNFMYTLEFAQIPGTKGAIVATGYYVKAGGVD